MPYLGRDFAEIARPDEAAGAVHVLYDDAGLALDMLDQVFGEQASFDVGRPAGGEIDQQRNALALVERLRGVEGGTGYQEECCGANYCYRSLQSEQLHEFPSSSSSAAAASRRRA